MDLNQSLLGTKQSYYYRSKIASFLAMTTYLRTTLLRNLQPLETIQNSQYIKNLFNLDNIGKQLIVVYDNIHPDRGKLGY